MRSFDDLLKESASIHGHLCAGQVLGVRMAMVGCREVGIEEPKGSKKLLVYVEIDRCATDAMRAVTGCSLGKRSLKFLDYGKMAATFVNLETRKAFRVLARDEARTLAASYVKGTSSRDESEREAYALMPEEVLFCIQPKEIQIPEEDLPGARSGRVLCERCGEGINFKREIKRNGQNLCIPCAQGNYLPQNGTDKITASHPRVLLVVGPRNAGKTTLIEKLIPHLSARGYRVATIKHHHSHSPLAVDHEGKDSWRHRKAGAKAVALVSPTEAVVFHSGNETGRLDRVMEYLGGVDIVLVEGFHWESQPRIQVGGIFRDGTPSSSGNGTPLAMVSREKYEGLRCFSPDETQALADFIESKVLNRS